MKFKHVRVLDDPRAEIESSLLINDTELQNRVPVSYLIDAALGALQSSKSLTAFYSKYIRDSKEGLYQIADCAANARKVLDEEEQKFASFTTKIIHLLSSGQVKSENYRDHHQAILSLVDGYMRLLKKRGASEVGLWERTISDTYIYFSYIFHRALSCFRSGSNKRDPNDYEDGYICLHIKLNTPYCLVTEDKKMKDALEETIALGIKLNEPQYQTTLQVRDADHLRQLA
ncbi:MAG: hypothetical protein ACREOW_02430 [Thermodesulfobacteriota bacterium]